MVTYCSFVSIQYTIYEKLMDYFKRAINTETYAKNETKINVFSGFVGGIISVCFTNFFETITVAKQVDPTVKVL